MKPERIEQGPRSEQVDALQRIESEVRLGELELQKGHRQEGEDILWDALADASGQKNTEVARKILEILTGPGTVH